MKKWICIFLALGLSLILTGCSALQGLQTLLSGQDAVAAAEAEQYFWFSKNDVLGDEGDLRLKVEDFADYEPAYAQYHGNLLYSSLSSAEQVLYRALAYALEQGYILVAADQGLQLPAQQCESVLVDFSLDSPLVEQNLWYATGECSIRYPVSVLGLYNGWATFNGTYLLVENFAAEWWGKKTEAIAAAREILQKMPQNLSKAKQAEWLYRYLVEHTEYYDYDGAEIDQIQPYLYDALVVGKTHCDGLTNALGLLYTMAGLKAAEKIYFAAEDEAVGHTWNVFEIDGEWYNADATGRDTLPRPQTAAGGGLHFGYADLLQEYTPYNADRYPVCQNSLCMSVDAHLQSVAGDAFISAVEQGYAAHGQLWALVVVDSYTDKTLRAQIQKLANRWDTTVSWMRYPLYGGRTAVLIYSEELFE